MTASSHRSSRIVLGAMPWLLALACTVEPAGPPSKADPKAAQNAERKAEPNRDDKGGGLGKSAADAVADAKREPVEAKAADTKVEAPAAAADPAAAGSFRKGDMARTGMTPEQIKQYAIAQGDPTEGEFGLADAFGDDKDLGDTSKGKLFAKFKTTMGEFDCELYEDKAPKTVANFVGLARGSRPSYDHKLDTWVKRKYYDGVLFHRVIKGFMIQTGDPSGTGTGTPGRPEPGKPALPGYVIEDEFDKSLRHDGGGYLSMANRGPNTGGSQFFVTVERTPHLDGKHAIFGKCDAKVPTEISEVKVDPRANHRPYDAVKIESIEFFRKK